jgi:diguanylate cyclase (GGDEF)-like protein
MPPYVLLVDADLERAQACLDAIRPFGIDVHVADAAKEALGMVTMHGLPRLLVIDLQAAPADGFATIDAARQTDWAGEVIAWAPSRAVREFAAHRFKERPIHLFAREAAARVGRAAIERALRAPQSGAAGRVDEETAASLLASAQRLCGAAGAAVYLRPPGESRFRSSVAWSLDVPVPDIFDSLPHVFDMMLDRGEPLFWSDHGAWALSGGLAAMAPSDVQALAAVPIMHDEQTVGVVCVFDVNPLGLDGVKLEAFKALGRVVFEQKADSPSALVPVVGAPARGGKQEPAVPTLLDRRSGAFVIARELARARRAQEPLSVVLFAVDFVNTNRVDAEEARDAVAAVYDTLTAAVRGSDLAIRWSEAEFLLVLAGLTAAEARPIAERIRAVTHAAQRHAVAVSGGIAELVAAESAESVVARASERVQLARARGHNRVA